MVNSYKKIHWTEHSKIKMRQYGLSITKLLGILHKPERKEKGIVPGTTAVMKTNKKYGNKTASLFIKEKNPPKVATFRRVRAPGEIWMMYKDVKMSGLPTRKIISAWRYPGVSKPGEPIPIPDDIKNEILNNN